MAEAAREVVYLDVFSESRMSVAAQHLYAAAYTGPMGSVL